MDKCGQSYFINLSDNHCTNGTLAKFIHNSKNTVTTLMTGLLNSVLQCIAEGRGKRKGVEGKDRRGGGGVRKGLGKIMFDGEIRDLTEFPQ